MAEFTRTFVGLDFPEPNRDALRRLQEDLARQAPDVRWVPPKQLHLTLAFLGDVPTAELSAVVCASTEVARRFAPFALTLAGLGAFPKPSRPRIVWAGLAEAGLVELHELQAELVEALRAAHHPPAGAERFTAHVTLGRLRDGRGRPPDLTAVLELHEAWTTPAFEVSEVVVYASTLGPGGPSYTALARAPLDPRKAESGP